MRLSILGKDSKVKDTKPLEVVDAYIRENTTEVIDPLQSAEGAGAEGKNGRTVEETGYASQGQQCDNDD